ncbi:MAG: glycine cleavage T C-terminal barrel domain-containing protein [Bryobacteraceae bacterium]
MRLAPYHSLRDSAAWIDLGRRGIIRVTGEDRARLLHALATNHVQELEPGATSYAFFLNAQGRILADAHILCLDGALLLDTEPENAAAVYEHIDRYIIADDAALDDQTGKVAVIAVEGPTAAAIATAMGIDPVPEPGRWVDWNTWIAARISASGGDGIRIYAPEPERDRVIGWVAGLGIVEAGEPELRVVRLENAHPRHGQDFSAAQIPHETQLLAAVSFNKGCYLGQEIVERVRSRGQVNRKLVQVMIEGKTAPAPKAKIESAGAEVGEITTAAYSPALDRVVGLAYVRLAQAGAELQVNGASLEVTGRMPA